MLQVTINQTFGRVGIDYTPAVFKMRVQPADIEFKQTPAEFILKSDPPAIKIDLTRTRASMGYKNIVPLAKDFAQEGIEAAQAEIRRTAGEGDRLARVEAGGSPFSEIAAAAAWPEHDFNITMIPKVPPDISYTGGVKAKSQVGKFSLDTQVHFPEGSATRAKLEIYLKEKPNMNINVTGQWVDFLG